MPSSVVAEVKVAVQGETETEIRFEFQLQTHTLTPSRKRSSPSDTPERLKKRKLQHSFQSSQVLQPSRWPTARAATHCQPICFAASTTLKGNRSKMAPSDAVWIAETLHLWLPQRWLQERFEEWCMGKRRILGKRHSLSELSLTDLVSVRPRSTSAPPEVTETSTLPETAINLFDAPAILRAQLVSALRSRLTESGTPSLRMRKWVIWNAWTRRPVATFLPQRPWLPATASLFQQQEEEEEQEADPSLLALQRHLLGDVSQYSVTVNNDAAISSRMKRSHSAPEPRLKRPVSPLPAADPPKPASPPKSQRTHVKRPTPNRPYALRSVACQS